MRFTKLLALVFVLALIAAACGDSSTTTTSGGTQAPTTEAPTTDAPTTDAPAEFPPPAMSDLGGVLIGAGESVQIRTLQSISGGTEFLGVDQNRGTELAVEDYGDLLGHSVDLGVFEDDLCGPEGGAAGAQAIVAQDGVLGVVGTTCSGAAAAASPIITGAGMVLISGSNTSPSLTSDLEGNANENYQPGYYRTAHNDLFQGAAAAEYAFSVLGFTNAAAIHDGDPYTDGLATSFSNAFTALGGTVSVYTAVAPTDTDMVPVLTEVAAGEPEVIYFPIFQPAGDFIAQQARGVSGLEDVQLFGADGLFVGGEGGFMSLAESEGMYFSGPNLVFTNSGFTGVNYGDLKARYEADYGEAPLAAFHAHTYDATMILLSSIEAVAKEGPGGELWVDRQDLRDHMNGLSGFPGVTGSLTCDAFGDCGSQAIAIFFHEDATATDAIAAATVVANLTKDGGFSETGN